MATVCGAVMCKNEEAVIDRCLLSLLATGCDYIFVLDTGSTDDTVAVADLILAGFPHQIVSVPFVDFGTTRTELTRRASKHGDWVLMMDADCTITMTDSFLPPEGGDLGMVDFMLDGLRSRRATFLRSGVKWLYESELHEFVTASVSYLRFHVGGAVMEHHGVSGSAREAEDDLATFQRLSGLHPENPMWLFHIAQILKGLERSEEAIATYRACASLGDPGTEWVWYSMLQAALLSGDLYALGEACLLRPHRAEGYYAMACLLIDSGRPDLAVPFAQKAAALPDPVGDGMFVNLQVYVWAAKMELAIALAMNGDLGGAIGVNEALLAQPDLPEAVKLQVEGMLHSQQKARLTVV